MISAEDLGGLLFGIHDHAGNFAVLGGEMGDHVIDPNAVIYREEDIISLLRALGFPEPVWGKIIKIEDYVMEVEKRKTTEL